MSNVDKIEENYNKRIPPNTQGKELCLRATKDL